MKAGSGGARAVVDVTRTVSGVRRRSVVLGLWAAPQAVMVASTRLSIQDADESGKLRRNGLLSKAVRPMTTHRGGVQHLDHTHLR
jgi:hypothetical protein